MKHTQFDGFRPSRIACAMTLMFGAALPAIAAPGSALGPPQAVMPFAGAQQSRVAVGRGADGSTVVVWRDFSRLGIFGRRFDSFGSPLDNGFRISNVGDVGMEPDVAVDDDGDFVVVWSANTVAGNYGANNQIRARRFTADGVAAGAVMDVADAPNADQDNRPPAVAVDADGDFVVAWDRLQRLGSADGPLFERSLAVHEVLARRFDRASNSLGAAVVVDQQEFGRDALVPLGGLPILPPLQAFSTTRLQSVDVAMDDDGDFVVVWGGDSRQYALAAIGFGYAPALVAEAALNVLSTYHRRYRAAGAPIGPRRLVDRALSPELNLGGLLPALNPLQTPRRSPPSVSMDGSGRFVVAWSEQDGRAATRVRFRRHAANGNPDGQPVTVATEVVPAAQVAVASSTAGEFVLAWRGATNRVDARRYDVAGRAAAPAFAVSATDAVLPSFPTVDVAADAVGNFAVAWDQRGPASAPDLVVLRSYQGP